MDLPIDARRAPFKEKYLDEETPMLRRWTILGYDPDDLSLCISDSTDDVFVGLTATQAASILIARDVFVRAIIKTLNEDRHAPHRIP